MREFNIIRGGSWLFGKKLLRGANCLGYHTDLMGDTLGFRVVRDTQNLVLQGGCWAYYPPKFLIGSHQGWTQFNASGYGLGFRVVYNK